MNAVLRAGIAALGFLCLSLSAAVARAQDEGDDVIKKRDNATQVGKVKSESLKGCVVEISKAALTIPWKDIKSIDYAGSPDFKKAKGYVDAGAMNDAIPMLEDLRKQSGLRAVLKPHVLNLLGSCYARVGDLEKTIEVYGQLFKDFPGCQFLVLGGGENLINAYLGKGGQAGTQGATEALKMLQESVKQVGGDPSSLTVLRGRVQEAGGDFTSAKASYDQLASAATDDATKAAAELGVARCLQGLGKAADAEAKYRGLVSRDLPVLVLAGAWNGLGDLMFAAGKAKPDADVITDALYAYLRGSVLYTPNPGESTQEFERALRGSADCFTALSQIETKQDRKNLYAARAKERLEYLQTKFPSSRYLADRK